MRKISDKEWTARLHYLFNQYTGKSAENLPFIYEKWLQNKSVDELLKEINILENSKV